jgi:uncharacterized membrane protein
MKENLSFNERFAVTLTRVIGTMPMFYGLILWYVIWIGANVILGPLAFDKPWSFPTLLMISNFLQLIWLPALSVGQNVLNRATERQNQRQYELVQRIDRMAGELHTMMETQAAVISSLIDLGETSIAVLKQVEAKTQEIDAEVDAWSEAAGNVPACLTHGEEKHGPTD